jgi:hypothetical protein
VLFEACDNVDQAPAITSLFPSPFPFTAFVIGGRGTAIFAQAPSGCGGHRPHGRFTLLGLLALRFRASILKWSENHIVQGFLVA